MLFLSQTKMEELFDRHDYTSIMKSAYDCVYILPLTDPSSTENEKSNDCNSLRYACASLYLKIFFQSCIFYLLHWKFSKIKWSLFLKLVAIIWNVKATIWSCLWSWTIINVLNCQKRSLTVIKCQKLSLNMTVSDSKWSWLKHIY